MISVFVDFFKNKDIRKKIFFTLAMLFIVRLGAAIPAPGINDTVITLGSSSLLAMMNLLGGGAIEQMSIFSLGVGPYINASIIIQLLSMDIIPALTEMSKDGKRGSEKIDRITRYLAVVMGLVQGYFIVQLLSNQYGIVDNPGWITYLYVSIIFTAGTMFLLWIGDQITTKGVGNGVSIIIFAGIVANMPNSFRSVYQNFVTTNNNIFGFILYMIMYVAIIVLVILMDAGQRRIPIQYSSSSPINRTKGDLNYLPLRINSASVLPVIFTGALIQGPQIIKPGKETTLYIQKVLNRITTLGALLLAFIAVLPYVVSMTTGLPTSAALGGTGVIIAVGVATETISTLKAQLTQKKYTGFIGK